MNGHRLRVVVAEDEALSRKRLTRLLQEAGCAVVAQFAEGRGAFEWLQRHSDVDALFLDIHMPNLDGLAILKSFGERLPVVLTTACPPNAMQALDSELLHSLC